MAHTLTCVVLLYFQMVNLTRFYVSKHQDFVVPLIMKYAEVWHSDGDPIYRPLWWLSPDDPVTFTVDDQFLIGDEVYSFKIHLWS